MKVVVSATGKDLDAQIDPRFGRCAYLIFVDTVTMDFTASENQNNALSGGAGIQTASFAASQGVQAVLTGNCGPKALATFSAAGIAVYTGQSGTVGEAVRRFDASAMQPSTQPTVAEKSGVSPATGAGLPQGRGTGRCRGGSGRGMGMGGGGGRGMGGGRGAGMGAGMGARSPVASVESPASSQESLESLRKQAEALQRQMEAIQAKINEMK